MNNVFNQGTEGGLCSAAGYFGRELVPMITYSELFTFVIMLCAVITLVIYIKRKK